MNSKVLSSLIIALSILFVPAGSTGQIADEISSMVDTTETIINNGRKLLMKSLKDNDYNKAGQVYYYLLTAVRDENCAAFSYHEQLFITATISNWYRWLELAANLNENKKQICYSNVYQIDQKLYELFRQNIDLLIEEEKGLSAEESDLLDLYLYLIKNEKSDEIYSEKLKAFKKNYPMSKYNIFVQNYLPGKQIKGSFGFALGVSNAIGTNKLGEILSPGLFGHMSMDININKVYTSVYLSGGSFRLRSSFSTAFNGKDTTFRTGENLIYTEGGLCAGYFLVRNSRVHLAPFATLAGNSLKTDVYKPDEDKEDDELKIINSFLYGLGFHAELKLFKFTTKNRYQYSYPVLNNISLKVDVGYNLIAIQNRELFKGNILYARTTLVWSIGQF